MKGVWLDNKYVLPQMRNLAIEAAPMKVRVNTINPSPVDNRMMRSLEACYALAKLKPSRRS